MTPVEVLAAHGIVDWFEPGDASGGGKIECDCGLWFGDGTAHAAHVLDALAEAGHVVVTLPEGTRDDDGQVWFFAADVRVDTTGPHAPSVWRDGHEVYPAALRREAGELLAAAAETGGKA